MVVETCTAPKNRDKVKVIALDVVMVVVVVHWLLSVGRLVGRGDWS